MDNRKISELTVDEFYNLMTGLLDMYDPVQRSQREILATGGQLVFGIGHGERVHGVRIDENPMSGTFGQNISPFK